MISLRHEGISAREITLNDSSTNFEGHELSYEVWNLRGAEDTCEGENRIESTYNHGQRVAEFRRILTVMPTLHL